jgi:TPR repeat protein
MNTRTSITALAALALLASVTARADFNAALKEYQAGQYDQARTHFTSMAELGDCSSQFNLGAMTLHGLGGPKDTGIGAGWLQAAVSNGCQQLVGGQLEALQGRMSDAERRSAAGIVTQYGRDTLHAQGIVDPDLDCRTDVRPSPVVSAVP